MVLNNITHILDRFVIVSSLHEENQNQNSNMSGQNENQSSEKNSEEKKAASSFVDSGIHDCSKTSSQEELTQILEKVPNYESFNIHLTDDEDEEKKAVVSSSIVKESVKEIEMQMKLDYMAQVNKMQSEECLRAKEVVEVLLETNICLEKELKELIVSHEEECRMLRNEIIALKKREAEMNKELELLRNTVKIIEKELNTFSKVDDKEVVKRKINEVNETNDNESTKKTRLIESPVVKSSTETQTLEKSKRAKSSDIEIVDHRLETKSIVLSNHSSEPFDLGKYELVSYLNGNEAIRYKFHKAVEIGPKKQLILWSRLSIEKKHFPPNDFTIGNLYRDDMREIFIWDWLNKDDVITDALYDPDGNEITRTNFNIIMDPKETVNINCTI